MYRQYRWKYYWSNKLDKNPSRRNSLNYRKYFKIKVYFVWQKSFKNWTKLIGDQNQSILFTVGKLIIKIIALWYGEKTWKY